MTIKKKLKVSQRISTYLKSEWVKKSECISNYKTEKEKISK